MQSECSVPSNVCYAVPHNLLKPLVLVLFQALGMEIQRYRSVCCAVTEYEPVADLIVYRICENIVMEHSHVK
jgi:hypothetical protein